MTHRYNTRFQASKMSSETSKEASKPTATLTSKLFYNSNQVELSPFTVVFPTNPFPGKMLDRLAREKLLLACTVPFPNEKPNTVPENVVDKEKPVTKKWNNMTREELLACTMSFSNRNPQAEPEMVVNDSRLTPELASLKQMLDEVQNEPCYFKKTMAALRIFHYMEYHHQTLNDHPRFREIVRRKANEFIEVAKQREAFLCVHSPDSDAYKAASYFAMATKELEKSCNIVLSIIQGM